MRLRGGKFRPCGDTSWNNSVINAAHHGQGATLPGAQGAFMRGGVYAPGQAADDRQPGFGQFTGDGAGGAPPHVRSASRSHDGQGKNVLGEDFPFHIQQGGRRRNMPKRRGILRIGKQNNRNAFFLHPGQFLIDIPVEYPLRRLPDGARHLFVKTRNRDDLVQGSAQGFRQGAEMFFQLPRPLAAHVFRAQNRHPGVQLFTVRFHASPPIAIRHITVQWTEEQARRTGQDRPLLINRFSDGRLKPSRVLLSLFTVNRIAPPSPADRDLGIGEREDHGSDGNA